MKKILKNLSDLSSKEIRLITDKLDLHWSSKSDKNIDNIYEALKECKEKYLKLKELGNEGKDGMCYTVLDVANGKIYAMKTFRRGKTGAKLKEEYHLQKEAAKAHVGPKIHDFDPVSKYIVMDRMDKHLFRGKNILSKERQLEILNLFKKLDRIKIFYGDPNITNFMLKDDAVYLIDYGMSRAIDPAFIKKHGENPNYRLMTINLILAMKEHNCPSKGYKYLLRTISEEDVEKFKLES